ncbi:hypothetical protein P3T83_24955 [Pseudocitrobacter sp. 2023EL-00150]|uniref:hypothetical protein n=1 Tax=Pseudocitrobacter sp. 2023EL-00150 TaxID=3032322 RepID=UPI0023E384A7|nr:hypothetical protein [Pseudocitrobacter sp. 2023EL-00150]MDF3830934.1 hypothetical protein [Pseudocitrobacter sp. 2023EL-00150]
MNVFEMEGFLRGKCLPGDMKVNETNVEYLVRKLGQAGELTAAHSTIEKAREVTNCPDGVDLQEHLKQLVAENLALKQQEPKAWYIRQGDEVTTDPAEAKMWRGIPLVMANIETPATDSILRAAEARGVEKFATLFVSTVNMDTKHNQEFHKGTLWYARQLREGKAE